MTERKQKWLARTFFISLFSIAPVILGYYLSTVHVYGPQYHEKVEVYPFYTHSLYGALAIIIGWGVALIGGLLLLVLVVSLLFDSKEGLIPKAWRKADWS